MGGSTHRSRVFGDQPRKSETAQKKGVQFHGVEVREYARSMADNPSTEHGPPLGLDWEYKDVTREKNPLIQETASNYFPCAAIPIDDYEKETEDRRKAKMMEICKKEEEYMRKRKPKASSSLDSGGDSSSHTLTEEQMKQLSAHWLKIQPLSAKERTKIIRRHTDVTLEDIDEHQRSLHKTRMQRKSSTAAAEAGLDDFKIIVEFFQRRYRRYKTGISKEREQEMLWEDATEYWDKCGKLSSSSSSLTSVPSLRSSMRSSLSSVSR